MRANASSPEASGSRGLSAVNSGDELRTTREAAADQASYLDHFVIFGERHLRHLLNQFVRALPTTRASAAGSSDLPSTNNDTAVRRTIHCHSRLGGQLRFYQA